MTATTSQILAENDFLAKQLARKGCPVMVLRAFAQYGCESCNATYDKRVACWLTTPKNQAAVKKGDVI